MEGQILPTGNDLAGQRTAQRDDRIRGRAKNSLPHTMCQKGEKMKTDKTKFELAVELERKGWKVSAAQYGEVSVITAKTPNDQRGTFLQLQMSYFSSGLVTRGITHFLNDNTDNRNTQPHWLDDLPTPEQAAAKLHELNRPKNITEVAKEAEGTT